MRDHRDIGDHRDIDEEIGELLRREVPAPEHRDGYRERVAALVTAEAAERAGKESRTRLFPGLLMPGLLAKLLSGSRRTAAGQTAEQTLDATHAPQPARPRRGRLRVALYASLAVVLVSAAVAGTVVGLKHVRGGSTVLVIDDGTGAGMQPGVGVEQPGLWGRLPLASEGGWVDGLAMDPSDSSVLYATTGDGVFKSTDRAGSWQRLLSAGIGNYSVDLDPKSSSTIYVIYTNTYVAPVPKMMRSDDGGITWKDLSHTALMDAIQQELTRNGGYEWPSLSFDRNTDPCTLFVPVDTTWWKSIDRGETWVKAGAGEESNAWGSSTKSGLGNVGDTLTDAETGSVCQIEARVSDPGDPSLVYAGTSDGMFKSSDGGATWSRACRGLTCSAVSELIVDPHSPSTLYAVTPEGIFKSGDGGAQWSMILAGGWGGAGVYDSGGGWTSGGIGGSLVLAPSSPSTLYACLRRGIFRSEDGGATWTRVGGDGLPAGSFETSQPGVLLLLVASDDPNVVFARNSSGGVSRSTDGGETWTHVLGWSLELLADPNDPSVLYCRAQTETAAQGQDGQPYVGLFRSVDKGATWTTVGSEEWGGWITGVADMLGSGIAGLAVRGGTPSSLYAVHSGSGASGSYVTSRSTDGGTTWEDVDLAVPTDAAYSLLFDPGTPGVIYALTASEPESHDPSSLAQHIYCSRDSGATWEDITGNLSACIGGYQIVVDPAPGEVLYAVSPSGLFKWTPAD